MTDSINSHINDKFETNSTNTHIDSKVGENEGFENNGSKTDVPKDMVEKENVDEVITDREDRVDENEVVSKSIENKTKQDHLRSISKYDHFLDLPISLRKGTGSCIKYSIFNYVLYENLSHRFRAFTASLDSTMIPKNIHLALEYL